MRRTARAASSAVALAVLGVAGCTSTTSGSASLDSTNPDSTSPAVSLAPPITRPPVSLASLEGNVCDALPDAYLLEIGAAVPGTPKQPGPNDLGPECAWKPGTPDGPILTVRVNNATGGIEGAYQRRSNFQQFTELTVDGFPAVDAQRFPDPAVCSLSVGVNDEQMLGVDLVPSYGTPDSSDPCATASDVATQVLTKLAG